MKTLIIKDLARTEDMDRSEMAAVRGGYSAMSSWSPWPMVYSPTSDSSVHVNQNLAQGQQVLNETADGSAFLSGIDVTNKTKQFGQNNVFVG